MDYYFGYNSKGHNQNKNQKLRCRSRRSSGYSREVNITSCHSLYSKFTICICPPLIEAIPVVLLTISLMLMAWLGIQNVVTGDN